MMEEVSPALPIENAELRASTSSSLGSESPESRRTPSKTNIFSKLSSPKRLSLPSESISFNAIPENDQPLNAKRINRLSLINVTQRLGSGLDEDNDCAGPRTKGLFGTDAADSSDSEGPSTPDSSDSPPTTSGFKSRRQEPKVGRQRKSSGVYSQHPSKAVRVASLKKGNSKRRLSMRALDGSQKDSLSYVLDPDLLSYLKTELNQRTELQADEALRHFQGIQFFDQLPRPIARRLLKSARQVHRERYQEVFVQDTPCSHMYVLFQGKVWEYFDEPKSQKKQRETPEPTQGLSSGNNNENPLLLSPPAAAPTQEAAFSTLSPLQKQPSAMGLAGSESHDSLAHLHPSMSKSKSKSLLASRIMALQQLSLPKIERSPNSGSDDESPRGNPVREPSQENLVTAFVGRAFSSFSSPKQAGVLSDEDEAKPAGGAVVQTSGGSGTLQGQQGLTQVFLEKYGNRIADFIAGVTFCEELMKSKEMYPFSIVAAQDCELLSIEKHIYARTMAHNYPLALSVNCYNTLTSPLHEQVDMPMGNVTRALMRHPLFVDLNEDAVNKMRGHMMLHDYPRLHQIFQAGDPCYFFFIILSGSVSIHSTEALPESQLLQSSASKESEAEKPEVKAVRRMSLLKGGGALGGGLGAGSFLFKNKPVISPLAVKRWKTVTAAIMGPVFGGTPEFCDPESPYRKNDSEIPLLAPDVLQGVTLKRTHKLAELFGPCHKMMMSEDIMGSKELCMGTRHDYTAVTRENTQILVFDHVAHSVFMNNALTEKQDFNPARTLQDFLSKPRGRRSRLDAANLLGYMRSRSFFKNLNSNAIINILLSGRYRKTNLHEVVFQQGDPADRFYVILSGEVSIHITGQPALLDVMKRRRLAREFINRLVHFAFNKQHGFAPYWAKVTQKTMLTSMNEACLVYGEEIRRLDQGLCFGDLAMQKNEKEAAIPWRQRKVGRRAATIVSSTQAEFLTLTCEEYDRVVRQHVNKASFQSQQKALVQVPVLAQLSVPALKRCATWMMKKVFPTGAIIANMTDAPVNMYFIISGDCKIIFNSIMHPVLDLENVREKAEEHLNNELAGILEEDQQNGTVTMTDKEEKEVGPDVTAGYLFGLFEHMMAQRSYTKSLVAMSHVETYEVNVASFLKELQRQSDVEDAQTKLLSWAQAEAQKLEDERAQKIAILKEAMFEDYAAKAEEEKRLAALQAHEELKQMAIEEANRLSRALKLKMSNRRQLPRHQPLSGTARVWSDERPPSPPKKALTRHDLYKSPIEYVNQNEEVCTVCCPLLKLDDLHHNATQMCPHMKLLKTEIRGYLPLHRTIPTLSDSASGKLVPKFGKQLVAKRPATVQSLPNISNVSSTSSASDDFHESKSAVFSSASDKRTTGLLRKSLPEEVVRAAVANSQFLQNSTVQLPEIEKKTRKSVFQQPVGLYRTRSEGNNNDKKLRRVTSAF